MISFNTLRPRQNGRRFADDIFKRIFLNENVSILIKISLNFIPKGPINNIPALVQIMAWHRPGDKPLSEPMMVNLLTHICVSRPQWVKERFWKCCLQILPVLFHIWPWKLRVLIMAKFYHNLVHEGSYSCKVLYKSPKLDRIYSSFFNMEKICISHTKLSSNVATANAKSSRWLSSIKLLFPLVAEMVITVVPCRTTRETAYIGKATE